MEKGNHATSVDFDVYVNPYFLSVLSSGGMPHCSKVRDTVHMEWIFPSHNGKYPIDETKGLIGRRRSITEFEMRRRSGKRFFPTIGGG